MLKLGGGTLEPDGRGTHPLTRLVGGTDTVWPVQPTIRNGSGRKPALDAVQLHPTGLFSSRKRASWPPIREISVEVS